MGLVLKEEEGEEEGEEVAVQGGQEDQEDYGVA